MSIFRVLGIVGLFLCSVGVVTRNRRRRDYIFILGGVFLEGYSWFLGDYIFMSLQVIFVLAAVWDLWKIRG